MITKTQLTPGTKFKIHNGNNLISDKIFEMHDNFISEGGLFGKQMNIEKMGNHKITLYTFNMIGIISTATVKYEDIEIITE